MRGRKALLVGIDGCNLPRIDAVRAPTLRRLRDEAYYATGEIYPDPPGGGEKVMTVSGPGWSTILTGTWPWTHGVLDNDLDDNAADHRLAEHPDLITRATRAGLRTFYAATWPPLYDRILTREVTDRTVLDQDRWPDYQLAVAGATAHAVADGAELAFAYFGSPDERAHASGATSPQYDRALEEVDGYLAALLRTVEARTDDDWLVLVTTYHGHRPEGGHGGQSAAERATFVLGTGGALDAGTQPNADPEHGANPEHGPETRPTRMVDIAPTILAHLGVRAEGLDGVALSAGDRDRTSRNGGRS